MKLITKGQDVTARLWRGRCHCCNAEFEASASEVEAQRPGSLHAPIQTLDCPECKAKDNLYMRPVRGAMEDSLAVAMMHHQDIDSLIRAKYRSKS